MIGYARRAARRGGLGNVTFEQADAEVGPFAAGAFDVAVSRNGATFSGDPVAAFTNIARALRPCRRLCLLVWQSLADNEWLRVGRLDHPGHPAVSQARRSHRCWPGRRSAPR